MPLPVSLQADCSKCAALCCIAFAFTKGEDFAVDKEAGDPCQHLCEDGKCGIYGAREGNGFSGCLSFDCLGAGQRVTQDVFGGRSWQDEPELTGPMCDALRVMRRVHQQMSLLEAAGALPLSPEDQARRGALIDMLSPEPEWTPDTLSELRTDLLERDVQIFLTGLQAYFPKRTG